MTADLDAPCTPEELFAWVDDLGRYPDWLDIVPRAVAVEPHPDDAGPAWSVDLRGRLGPLARSKRLRMVRTALEPGRVRFERVEHDGRRHSPWVLEAAVDEADERQPPTGPPPLRRIPRGAADRAPAGRRDRPARARGCSRWWSEPDARAPLTARRPRRSERRRPAPQRAAGALVLARAAYRPSRRSRSSARPNTWERAGAVRTCVDRPGHRDPPLPEQQRVGEATRDLLDVVGDEHGRRRGRVVGEVGEAGDEVFAGPEVEPGGRLVEQDETRGRPRASGRAAPAGARPRRACRTSGRRGPRRPCAPAGRGRGRGRRCRSCATRSRAPPPGRT